MVRPLRIQFPDAWYHVMNRGRRGDLIFKDTGKIKEAVCRSYDISEEDLLKSRRGMTNEPRNAAIYLMRQVMARKLEEIGLEFGMNSYSSVSTVIERTKEKAMTNREFRKRIEKLKLELMVSQEHKELTPSSMVSQEQT